MVELQSELLQKLLSSWAGLLFLFPLPLPITSHPRASPLSCYHPLFIVFWLFINLFFQLGEYTEFTKFHIGLLLIFLFFLYKPTVSRLSSPPHIQSTIPFLLFYFSDKMRSQGSVTAMLLLMMFTLSSASDMSIISYDETHPDKSTLSWRTDDEVMAMYEEWLVKHGKTYNGLGEKERRFQIFKDNLRFIDEHNANESQSFKVGLNRFADLNNEEYRAIYLGIKKPNRKVSKASDRYAPLLGENLPDSVDWREKGAVAEVKDQGGCGKFLFQFPFMDASHVCLKTSILTHIFRWFSVCFVSVKWIYVFCRQMD